MAFRPGWFRQDVHRAAEQLEKGDPQWVADHVAHLKNELARARARIAEQDQIIDRMLPMWNRAMDAVALGRSRALDTDETALAVAEKTNSEPQWKPIAENTERLPVPGGWIYVVYNSETHSIALCFVPEQIRVTTVMDRIGDIEHTVSVHSGAEEPSGIAFALGDVGSDP